MQVDVSKWSGEGTFTQTLLECLQTLEGVDLVAVEDAPASRSDADYNFISNEVFVRFATRMREERGTRFGVLPTRRTVAEKAMTVPALERALTALPNVGAPDYADEAMLQYLRTERIIPPYQTRGYKLVELVRVYEVGTTRRGGERPVDS